MEPNDRSSVQWALDLIEMNRTTERSLIGAHMAEIFMGLAGLCAVPLMNVVYKRPLYSSIHMVPIYGTFAFLFGHGIQTFSNYRAARRMTVLEEYVLLHPDRFPEPPNRKFADIFQPWTPVR